MVLAFQQYFSHTWTTEEALPRVLGNGGIRPFISGEQENKHNKLKRTGDQKQIWGTENTENQDFEF